MDHERAGFIPVHTHQDGTTVSAFAFDRRIGRFQRRRRRGHRFNKRRWNDLEGLLRKGGHCCHQFQIRCAVYSSCGLFIKLQRSHTTTAEPNWLHREAEAGSVQSPRSVAGEAASGRARNIPELKAPHERLEWAVQRIALTERASRAHNYSRLSITPR
jgi:hypothetical protein